MKHDQGQTLAKNFDGSQLPWTLSLLPLLLCLLFAPSQLSNLQCIRAFTFCKTVA